MNALFSDTVSAKHVLLVDEDAQERFVLQEMLQGNGFRFSHAETYRAGADLARRDRPDIVLASLLSDEHESVDIESVFRSQQVTRAVPILLVTTAKRLGEGVQPKRSDVLEFLIRPFTVGQLVDRVQAQLRMAALLREQGSGTSVTEVSAPPDDWELIGRAKMLLEERLAEVNRAADLAQALRIPERRLAFAFQQCLGISAVEFIRQERIRKAKLLLTSTTLSVREIALKIGFSSAANFSTAFNSQAGTSPSSFRNQALSNALMLDRGVNPK